MSFILILGNLKQVVLLQACNYMPLDFGRVQDYDCERGFGFVSHTVWASTRSDGKVFFHIKKIKPKYLDFARQLDNGNFFDESFWYNTENTSKGEQVTEVWRTAEEIPLLQRTQLISHVESLWRNIQTNTPSWLNRLTEELIGQLHQDQLRQERDNSIRQYSEAEAEKTRIEVETRRREEERRVALENERIEAEQRYKAEEQQLLSLTAILKAPTRNQVQQICNERNITTCVHFTHVQNLRSILNHGLLGRSLLEAKGKGLQLQPQYNDQYRLDGCREAISLSISFPNYRMFYKYSNNNRAEWVVLLLDVSLLWDLKCAFCKENAAATAVTQIPLAQRMQVASFQRMFEDYGQTRRQNLCIPDHYPTNPQAEVLTFNPISPDYIKEVHFWTLQAAQRWLNNNGDIYDRYSEKIFSSEQYFVPRQDWEAWRPSLVF